MLIASAELASVVQHLRMFLKEIYNETLKQVQGDDPRAAVMLNLFQHLNLFWLNLHAVPRARGFISASYLAAKVRDVTNL